MSKLYRRDDEYPIGSEVSILGTASFGFLRNGILQSSPFGTVTRRSKEEIESFAKALEITGEPIKIQLVRVKLPRHKYGVLAYKEL